MQDQQQRIMGYFIEEARDHLNTLEQGLLNLQATVNDPEMINEVFRAAHSVKGGAAMLGLGSIQQTAHRLEDHFKVLKERPVPIDRDLESLFLKVFDTLVELLDHLQGSFGLTEEIGDRILKEAEPAFNALNLRLSQEIQSQGLSEEEAPTVLTPFAADETSESSLAKVFQQEVSQYLRQLLDRFKQKDDATGRFNLGQLCQQLQDLAQGHDLPGWNQLLSAARQAVLTPENSYRDLAPVLIRDIKAAQDLVMAGRGNAITVGAELQDLAKVVSETTEVLPFGDMQAGLGLEDDGIGESLEDLFTDGAEVPVDTQTEGGKDFDWLSANTTGMVTGIDGIELNKGNPPSAPALEPSALGMSANGPEVGDSELNTLANLFEGDVSELEDVWKTDDIESFSELEEDVSDQESNGFSDFSDLFFEGNTDEGTPSGADLDDGGFLNDDFLDELVIQQGVSELSDMGDVMLQELEEQGSGDTAGDSGLDDLLAVGEGDRATAGVATVSEEDLDAWFDSADGEADGAVAQALAGGDGLFDLDAPTDGGDLDLSLEWADGGLAGDSVGEKSIAFDGEGLDDLFSGLGEEAIASQMDRSAGEGAWAGDSGEEMDGGLLSELELEGEGLDGLLMGDDVGLSDDTSMAGLEGWLDPTDMKESGIPTGEESEPLDFSLEDGDAWELDDSVDDLLRDELLGTGSVDPLPQTEIETMVAEEEPESGDDDLGLLALDGDINSLELEGEGDEATSEGLAALGMGDLDELDQWLIEEEEDPGEGAIAGDDGDPLGGLEKLDALLEDSLEDDIDLALGASMGEGDSSLSSDDDLSPSDELADIAVPELDDPNVTLDLNGASLRQREVSPAADDALADLFGNTPPSHGPMSVVIDTGDGAMEDLAALEGLEELEELGEIGNLSELIGQETALSALPASGLLGDMESADLLAGEVSLDDLGAAASPDAGLGDLDELDGLLDASGIKEVPEVAGDLGELDALTAGLEFEGEASGKAGDLASLDQFLGEAGEAIPETGGVFAELEGLLEEEPEATAPSDSSSEAADGFDDLEALLQESADSGKDDPAIAPEPMALAKPAVETPERSKNPKKWRFEETIKVPVKTLDTLNNLVGEMVVNRNSLEQSQERLRQSIENLMLRVQQLGDVGQRMQDLYERSLLELSLLASRNSTTSHHPTGSYGGGRPVDDTIGTTAGTGEHRMGLGELELDRFTPFHTQSQEIIELIVRVRESASDIDFVVEEADQLVRNLRQVSTQIQEGLTKSRMVPFAQTADRLYRAVRNVSHKCGKEVDLAVEGKNTMIDKLIAEQLYDPITHLVNNAITHGIETPPERQKTGKAQTGRLSIKALYQGNQTIISVADDGAGIDVERVRQKAVEKGLVSAEQAKKLSNQEVYELLFQPGFTTKEQADDFAGRGVGMDVVRRNIQELRGNIVTDSTLGKGTSFTLRLPLNLSICKALQCLNDHAAIAFPMDGVEDMFTTTQDVVQVNSQEIRCIPWRDRLLPIHPLSELLKYNRPFTRSSLYGGTQEESELAIVILRSAGEVVAVEVDQVLGEQEIVIKQPEGPIPKPVGIAGMTVLGDGQVMPIADVLELIDLATGRVRRDPNGTWGDGDQPTAMEPVRTKTEPMVLIVDDSITVRELLKMTFLKSGYQVEQARDGQEAWEKLRSGLPCDLVFCDIEMPRMDGLEFLSRLQKEESLSHLPVAMLTSRGADKHRQMATSLGARGYFTKPYLEEALLDAAQRMLQGEVLVTANA